MGWPHGTWEWLVRYVQAWAHEARLFSFSASGLCLSLSSVFPLLPLSLSLPFVPVLGYLLASKFTSILLKGPSHKVHLFLSLNS